MLRPAPLYIGWQQLKYNQGGIAFPFLSHFHNIIRDHHVNTMSSILKRLTAGSKRETDNARSTSASTTPPATSTANQSGLIDPTATTIGSILERIGEEHDGRRIDMEEMLEQLDTAFQDWERSAVPLSGV
jgi:hypothetical protein